MRKWRFGPGMVALTVCMAACSMSTRPSSSFSVKAAIAEPFMLRVGQSATVDGTPVQVTFQRLLEDQRCPIDVICVWAGYVQIAVQFVAGAAEYADTLNWNREPAQIIHGGYALRLLDLQPPRRSTADPDPSIYVATLIVSRYNSVP